MNYVEYDPVSGEITRSGNCQDGMLALQANEGRAVVEGVGTASTHCIVSGILVPYSEDEIAAKSLRPTTSASWSNETMAWVSTESIEDCRDRRWQEIKTQRNFDIVQPKVTSVGTFDAKPDDIVNLNTVLALARIADSRSLPSDSNYTLANNVRSTFTISQLETAALEMGAQVQALYDAADVLREQIDNASSIEEVEAIEWAN